MNPDSLNQDANDFVDAEIEREKVPHSLSKEEFESRVEAIIKGNKGRDKKEQNYVLNTNIEAGHLEETDIRALIRQMESSLVDKKNRMQFLVDDQEVAKEALRRINEQEGK